MVLVRVVLIHYRGCDIQSYSTHVEFAVRQTINNVDRKNKIAIRRQTHHIRGRNKNNSLFLLVFKMRAISYSKI